MVETVALLVLAAALAGLGFFHYREAQAWRAERAQLLDRIMARSYTDYVYATKPETAEPPQLLTDSDEAKWYAEHGPKDDGDQYLSKTDAEWHRQNFAEHPEAYPDGLPNGVAA